MTPIGLYVHVPFCVSKCAYCDFYSFSASPERMDAYTDRLCADLRHAAQQLRCPADTLYLGGGTPSLLGGKRLARIVETARVHFGLENAEITLEANPADDLAPTLSLSAKAGVNRLSLGVQSGIADELRALGRRHTLADVERTVADARNAGIENISLDLMLGIPQQTAESLSRSIELLTALDCAHISAYLLKIEPNTPFGRSRPAQLPNEEESSTLYLQAVAELAARGYAQYEISNFARDGKISRHNTKYWTGAPYLGLGPAAHSMLNGQRFYFPADLQRYLRGEAPIADGAGGGQEEYILLRLRLRAGIDLAEYERLYGALPERAIERMRLYVRAGYAELDDTRFALTPQGFLLSNTLIVDLLDRLSV